MLLIHNLINLDVVKNVEQGLHFLQLWDWAKQINYYVQDTDQVWDNDSLNCFDWAKQQVVSYNEMRCV